MCLYNQFDTHQIGITDHHTQTIQIDQTLANLEHIKLWSDDSKLYCFKYVNLLASYALSEN